MVVWFWSTTIVIALGDHLVTITATGMCIVNGVYFHRGDEASGVQVWHSGRYGQSTTAFSKTSCIEAIGAIQPALVVDMMSSNDYRVQLALNTFRERHVDFASAVKASVCPPPSVLLATQHTRLDDPSRPISYAQYAAEMRAAAVTTESDFIDLREFFPGAVEEDVYRTLYSDLVHVGDHGHATLASLLGDAVTAPKGLTPTAAPVATLSGIPDWGLLAHWTAEDLSLTDGQSVETWAPSAGIHTQSLNQATGSKQPIYRANAAGDLPMVEFIASSQMTLRTAGWGVDHPLPLTVFFAGKVTGSVAGSRIYSGVSGVYFVNVINSTGSEWAMGAGASTEMTIGAIAEDASLVMCDTFNGADSRAMVNSLLHTALGSTGVAQSAKAGLNGFCLGSSASGTTGFADMMVGEVIIYSRAMTWAQERAIHAYLAEKWGGIT